MGRRLILAVLAAALLVSSCEPTGERRLVSLREGDIQPGHLQGEIVYVETRGVRLSSLYVHDLATDERQRIRGLPEGFINSPAWSPDGERIAFALSGEDGFSHIWTVNADGSEARQITRGEVLDDTPRWSPNGDEIVFASIRDGDYYWRLFRTPVDRESLEELGRTDGHSVFPDWSPDGRFIVYSNRSGDHYKLWLHDLETGEDRQLTEGLGDDRNARFSPDGLRIAYATNRDDDVWQLWELILATEQQRRFIGSDTMDEYPDYSHDMGHIVFSTGYLAIYRSDGGPFPDGQLRWRVTVNLAWSPDWRGPE